MITFLWTLSHTEVPITDPMHPDMSTRRKHNQDYGNLNQLCFYNIEKVTPVGACLHERGRPTDRAHTFLYQRLCISS